jgi:hypothetical protein
MRSYVYIGSKEIAKVTTTGPRGIVIASRADLERWLTTEPDAFEEGATFVIDLTGRLLLAPRRSEHVRCAGGQPVLAAGEVRFERSGDEVLVAEVTNQSTGYCPEPESWPAVASALHQLGIEAPPGYTCAFVFRRCGACRQVNVVKDGWFYCAACDALLPSTWNLAEA